MGFLFVRFAVDATPSSGNSAGGFNFTAGSGCGGSYYRLDDGTRRLASSFRSDARDIGFILAGAWQGTGTMEMLRFSVPEPGTLALLSLGFTGLDISRRRKAPGAGSGIPGLDASLLTARQASAA